MDKARVSFAQELMDLRLTAAPFAWCSPPHLKMVRLLSGPRAPTTGGGRPPRTETRFGTRTCFTARYAFVEISLTRRHSWCACVLTHSIPSQVYDANLEEPSGIAFSPAILYNTTDRTQTGVPDAPTLHTMPPIASSVCFCIVLSQ